MSSKLLSLKMNDFTKGLVVAILTAPFTIVYDVLSSYLECLKNNGDVCFLNLNWQMILTVAILGGMGYLTKNFFTDTEGKLGGVIKL